MIWVNPDYWKRVEKMQIVGEDIPPVKSVFELQEPGRAPS